MERQQVHTEKLESSAHPLWDFTIRALIIVAVFAAAFLLWHLRYAALMAFAAVIVAVLLLALTRLLRRIVPVGHSWGLAAAILLIVLAVGGFSFLLGAQVQTQFAQLGQSLPQRIEAVEERLGIQLFGGSRGGQAASPQGQQSRQRAAPEPDGAASGQLGANLPTGTLAGWLASFGVNVLNAIGGAIVVILAGVFLAAQPNLYRRGTAKLFAPSQHERVSETLSHSGRALRLWLIGELIAMAIVGVLVGLGTWLIGLPAPLALGLFAALTEFVPIVGPIIGAIPALLLAINEGGATILWTLVLFIAIQQIESNLIAPLVQERMVSLPPALFLLAIVAFGALFGILGIILAAPLLVVVYVAVQKLWIGRALHEEVTLPGDKA